MGLAVGDALGTTNEFKRLEAPPFPALATGPHDDVTGGGPFHVKPGQVTDDTHMACCIATTLVEKRGLDVDDLSARYVRWSRHTFDIGAQTRASISALERGQQGEAAGHEVWLAGNRRGAGNGSLMRTAPIGVFFAGRPEELRTAALLDSAITHYDPRCRIACAALNAAIGAAVSTNEASTAAALVDVAALEINLAARSLAVARDDERTDIEAARVALLGDLAAAHRDDPKLYSRELHLHDHQGFVRVAFRLAFWELVHAPSWKAGLVDVVNRGGDADTNGAIVGALLGALHGAEAIPEAWRKRVLAALQDKAPSPLRDDYHPKRLVALMEALNA